MKDESVREIVNTLRNDVAEKRQRQKNLVPLCIDLDGPGRRGRGRRRRDVDWSGSQSSVTAGCGPYWPALRMISESTSAALRLDPAHAGNGADASPGAGPARSGRRRVLLGRDADLGWLLSTTLTL